MGQGTKIASDGLKGRIIELSLADLNNNEAMSYRKVKLCVEDVQGYNCLLNFHGMDMTRDKLCSLIKKKQSIIEGYVVRMFCIAFTKKQDDQLKETCYAKSAKVRSIREKMVTTMAALAGKGDLKTLVKALVAGTTGEEIEREASSIFPIKDCYIRKVKVIKKPKFEVTALMEWHTDDGSDVGANVAPVVEEELVAGSGGRL